MEWRVHQSALAWERASRSHVQALLSSALTTDTAARAMATGPVLGAAGAVRPFVGAAAGAAAVKVGTATRAARARVVSDSVKGVLSGGALRGARLWSAAALAAGAASAAIEVAMPKPALVAPVEEIAAHAPAADGHVGLGALVLLCLVAALPLLIVVVKKARPARELRTTCELSCAAHASREDKMRLVHGGKKPCENEGSPRSVVFDFPTVVSSVPPTGSQPPGQFRCSPRVHSLRQRLSSHDGEDEDSRGAQLRWVEQTADECWSPVPTPPKMRAALSVSMKADDMLPSWPGPTPRQAELESEAPSPTGARAT